MTNTHTTDAIPSIRLWADTIGLCNYSVRVCCGHCVQQCKLVTQPTCITARQYAYHCEHHLFIAATSRAVAIDRFNSTSLLWDTKEDFNFSQGG